MRSGCRSPQRDGAGDRGGGDGDRSRFPFSKPTFLPPFPVAAEANPRIPPCQMFPPRSACPGAPLDERARRTRRRLARRIWTRGWSRPAWPWHSSRYCVCGARGKLAPAADAGAPGLAPCCPRPLPRPALLKKNQPRTSAPPSDLPPLILRPPPAATPWPPSLSPASSRPRRWSPSRSLSTTSPVRAPSSGPPTPSVSGGKLPSARPRWMRHSVESGRGRLASPPPTVRSSKGCHPPFCLSPEERAFAPSLTLLSPLRHMEQRPPMPLRNDATPHS